MNAADTAVRDAILADDLEAVHQALAAGAHLDGTGSIKCGPPLMLAAEHDRLAIMALLLDAGANIEAPGEGGESPLIAAVWAGNLAAASFLLQRGADVNGADQHGKTPLYAAASCVRNGRRDEDTEIGRLLLRAGANGDLACELTGGSAFTMCPDWVHLAAADKAEAQQAYLDEHVSAVPGRGSGNRI